MHMADYPFKIRKFCCHRTLILWQLQHFMNMGCLRNTFVMATFTRFLRKITAKLIDQICFYASCINEPSLNDSKKMWVFTLFTCLLLNIVQNVVRSLLSVGGPYIPNKDSDLPVQLRCLIRDTARHIMGSQGPKASLGIQQSWIRLCECAGWSELQGTRDFEGFVVRLLKSKSRVHFFEK